MSVSARDFFRQGIFLSRRIERLRERFKQLQSDACGNVSSYSNQPRVGTPESAVERAILRREELGQDIAAETKHLDEWRKIAVEAINSLTDGRLRDVLKWRYVRLWDWTVISEELNYSQAQAYRLHARALEEVQAFFDMAEPTAFSKMIVHDSH